MKIIYLVVRTDHASVYYRALQMVPRLAEQGVDITVATIPRTLAKRRALFRTLNRVDLVILHRKLFNWINFHPLRRWAKRLVYDLDDALFIKDSKSRTSYSLTRKLRFRRTAQKADFIFCGNDWIREKAAAFNPNTATIPTMVDLTRYPDNGDRPLKEGFTAVWIGSRSTLFYLEKIIPALEPLASQIKGFKLRVISDRFPESAVLEIEKIPWSRHGEAAALAACDVGLMPLFEDAWSQGKCGLKLLQYGAAGLPSICTPCGVNRKIVVPGESGFHAATTEAWQENLRILARDPELRSAMGRRARQIVAADFSVQSQFDTYLGLLRKIVDTDPLG